MRTKIICLLALSVALLTGCVSKAEFDALESRVSALEENSGYSSGDQSEGLSDQADPNNLISYVKNWDEVADYIEEALGKDDYVITDVQYLEDANNTVTTFTTFGNGKLELYADGIKFHVTVTEFVAVSVGYSDGKTNYFSYTKSGNPF